MSENLFFASAELIQDCISTLTEYVLNNTVPENFNETEFRIIISETLHPLLYERFNEDYDLDSRIAIFDKLQQLLSLQFAEDSIFRKKLNRKIQEFFPHNPDDPNTKEIVVMDVLLVDDCTSVVVYDSVAEITGSENKEENVISVEILL